MDQKSFDLKNLTFQPHQVAYDSATQSLLLANGSHLAGYNLHAQTLTSQTNWALPNQSSSEQSQQSDSANNIPANTVSLRFVPGNSQTKVLLSPSGLLATSQATTDSILCTNFGFSSGTHYWEIICPKNCQSVHIGVIKEGWEIDPSYTEESLLQVYSFKTTTPRVVGVKLDLEKGELRFWLNGVPQRQKTTKNIQCTTWYPCVKLKGTGTHVILNPFAADPEAGESATYTPESKISGVQIENALSRFVIFSGFQQLHKNPVNFQDVFVYENDKGKFAPEDSIIDSTGSMVAFRFANGLEAENFAQANVERKHNEQSLYFLDNSSLVASAIELLKSDNEAFSMFAGESNAESYTKMLTWVKRSLSEFAQHSLLEDDTETKSINQLSKQVIELASASSEKRQPSESAPTTQDSTSLSFQYINKGDSLLVCEGNLLKLLYKENGKFIPRAGLFANRPRNPKDEITLTLPKTAFISILSNIDFDNNSTKLFKSQHTISAAKEFLTAFKSGIEKSSSQEASIDIQIKYKYAKNFINTLLASLYVSLRWLKGLIQEATEILDAAKGKNGQEEKKDDLEKRFQRGRNNSVLTNLSINQIYLMIHTLVSIDESLYAMTLHKDTSSKLKRYWPNKRPRLFTAFARLGSLVTYPSNKFSLVQIAEAGLYNTQDILYDLRHFLDSEKRLEEVQNLRADEDLWSLLQKSLGHNRMVQGLPSENVPLHVSLNNLPPQAHSTDTQQRIINIASNDQTSFVSTVSQNGEIKLWNTELALIELGESNYRRNIVTKKSNLFKENVSDDNIVGFEVEQYIEESKPAKEEDGPVDEELLGTLEAMGFPAHLARKALIQVKNINIASAIDKIETLREQEKKSPVKPASPVKVQAPAAPVKIKYNLSKIKSTWECVACTFVNVNTKICDICGCVAPVTAYFREDELKAPEEPEEEEQPVEEEVPATDQVQEAPPKPFIETAKIFGNFIVPLQSSPISPVIVGVVFEEDAQNPQKYQLRFRRFVYETSYLQKFLQKDKNNDQYSLLSGAWFNKDSQSAYDHLSNEFGLSFRTLHPLFLDANATKKPLAAFDEVNFNIDAASGKLVGLTVSTETAQNGKDIAHIYLLWNNNSKYTLQQLDLVSLTTDPYNLSSAEKISYEVKSVFTQGVTFDGNFLSLEATTENLIITTDQQVQVFKPLKLEAPHSTIKVGEIILKAQLTPNNTLILLKANKSFELVQLEKSSGVGKVSTVTSDSSESPQVPDVNTLTEENIDTMCKSLHQRPLGGSILNGGDIIQSNLQSSTNTNSKFFLGVNSANPQLEITLADPTPLTNLEISTFFDLSAPNKLQSLEQEEEFLVSLQRRGSSIAPEASSSSSQAQPDSSVQASTADNQDGQLATLNMTEGDVGDKFLPLTVTSFKGAAQSEKYSVSRILVQNNDVFCTNYAESEFIFEHLHGKRMLVKSVHVQSKLKSVEKDSAPILSGLIFTADYLSHLDMTAPFHNMKHDQFQQWLKNHTESKQELQPWEPVGSFLFNEETDSLTVTLSHVRPSRYIMLKPTSVRNAKEEPQPIEIKFFGASGVAVSDDEMTVRKVTSDRNILTVPDTEILIEGHTEQKGWIHIQTLKDIPIQILHKNWESLSSLALSGYSTHIISNDTLFHGRFNKLRVSVLKAGQPSKWSLSGLTIQSYAPNVLGATSTLNISPAAVRNLLLDPKEFSKLNAPLIEQLTKQDLSHQKRGKIALLISEVISVEPTLVDTFYKHLNIKNFLQNSIIQERDGTFLEIQNFLQCFASQKSFAQDLLDAILQLLPSLSAITSITQAGLNGFFSLLAWCQVLNPEKVFNTLLSELHRLSQRISQARVPEYNILRTQYRISGLVLEKSLFSETNVSLKQSKRATQEETTEKKKEKEPLKQTFLAYYSSDVDEYLVDLGQRSRVDEIRLAFDNSNKSTKFRVQIWALQSNSQQKLIHSKFYNEATWNQVTSNAYDRSNAGSHYKSTEELECLGFNNLDTTTRYLKIQITYALLPFVQSPAEKADKKIIPEVYGESLTGETGEITEIQSLFNVKSKVQKDAVSYPHTSKYEKSEITGKNLRYKFLFTSVETQNKAGSSNEEGGAETLVIQDNEETLQKKLEELQTELLQKLREVKQQNSIPTNQDEISKLCDEIEDIQLKALNLARTASEPKSRQLSVDYLYSLAVKICQAISKIDSNTSENKRSWRQDNKLSGAEGQKIAYELFQALIIYENGPISKEFISFVSQILVNNLQDTQWRALINSIVDNFLAADTSSALPQYSFSHLIEVLDLFVVPPNELIKNITKRLDIQLSSTSKSSTLTQSLQQNPSQVNTLTAVLLLLNKQYEKSAETNTTLAKRSEFIKQSEEGTLKSIYYICVWLCQNLSLSENDTIVILSLALDVLTQVIARAQPKETWDILKDSQSFQKLFMSIVKTNSLDILKKFQAILNTIFDSQNKDEENSNEEAKLLLVSHLQTSLKWLINYSLSNSSSTTEDEEELSAENWQNDISFILDFLLTADTKLIDARKAVAKAKNAKKAGASSGQKPKEEGAAEEQEDTIVAADTFEKIEIIPLESIQQLVLLLSSQSQGSKFNLGNSSRAWELVMKALQSLKTSSLIEANILENLIKSFFTVGQEVQNIIYSKILELSLSVIKSSENQKESSHSMIKIIFRFLTQQNSQIAFALIKAWLDMLLTGETPRPEEFQNKPVTKAFCKISGQGALTVLTNLSDYLWNHLNLGSKEGTQCASDLTLQSLQIGDQLLTLLVTSESTFNVLAVGELFSNYEKHSQETQRSLQRLVQWYLINKASDTVQSPATDMINSLSATMVRLFEIIEEYQQVTKVAIQALVEGCKELDKALAKLQSSQQFSPYLTLQFSIRSCKVLEELFNLWVTNDATASYAALEIKGFEYLLEKMSFISQSSHTTTKNTGTSYLKSTDLFSYLSQTKPLTKQEPGTRSRAQQESTTGSTGTTIEEPKEEEFASKVTVINQEGQDHSSVTTNWAANKKGSKTRILYFAMQGAYYNEYPLLIKLDKTIELNQIKIGFNTVWTDHTDKVLGVPSSVIIEGGTSESNLTYLGTLEPMNDPGYTEYSVQVFKKNFKMISNAGDSLESALASISQKKITHLKFTFKRPVVNVVEELSYLSNSKYKNLAVGISFLSVTGLEIKKMHELNKKITENQEKSALQIISMLCNQQFVKTLQIIANEHTVVSKIKSSFETLSSLLVAHEAWLAPLFLAIASNNAEMGNWIIGKFLDLDKSKEHTKIIGEIALSNESLIFKRTIQIHTFINAELKKSIQLSKAESMAKFSRIVPFIEVFCSIVRSIPVTFAQENQANPSALPFTRENLDIILHSYEQYNASTHSKLLIKLMILYLYVPAPFAIEDNTLVKYALEKLWTLVTQDKKTLYYEMLGPLIIGSTFSAKWFLPHTETVLNDLLAKLENVGDANLKNLKYSFGILNSVSRNDMIKKKLFTDQWHLKIYEGLRNKDTKSKTILKKFDTNILLHAVDFLKNVILGYPQAEQDLAKVLINDIDLLDTNKDLFFVNNLLVPLLNAENDVPVCLYPINPQTGRVVTDPKRLPTSTTSQQAQSNAAPLKSKFLSDNQTQTLMKTITDLTNTANPSASSKKPKTIAWELAFSNTIDGESLLSAIQEKMANKGPILVIMEGTNAGKKCQIGAFSSQGIPEIPSDAASIEETSYQIPYSQDSFLFYYCDNVALHFPLTGSSSTTPFGNVHFYSSGEGCLSFNYGDIERLVFSYTQDQPSFAEIYLSEMTPLETDHKQGLDQDVIKDFVFQSAEYFVVKSDAKALAAQQTAKNAATGDNLFTPAFLSNWHDAAEPLNYYRASPVFNVPSSVTTDKLAEIALHSDIPLAMRLTKEKLEAKAVLADLYDFILNVPEANGIIDLDFDAYQMVEKKLPKKAAIEETDELKYKPALTFFESFEKNEGVKKMIDVGLRSLEKMTNKEEAKKWKTWLQELSSFGALPNFFGLFLKNKDCMSLLFKIITASIDQAKQEDDGDKKADEEEQRAVKFSYQILAEVFSVDTDAKLRDFAIDKQFFIRILDRIGLISKESKRKWYDDYKKKEREEDEKSASPEKSVTMDPENEDSYKKKAVKKKGVGYASDNTGENQKWNVSEYVESKKSKNEQLQATIEILTNFLATKDWNPPSKIIHQICESSLLPLLEAAFRSASLLEMAKEAPLNHSYLKLARAMALHKSLLPCLLDLDRHYQPPQKDSIYTLLTNLKDLAQIFLNCLTATEKENVGSNQKLAQDILDTYHHVDQAIQNSQEFEEGNDAEFLDILSQPLNVAYRTLLQNLRFDYVSMKDSSGKLNHHYASYVTEATPSKQKMERLAQELADLSTALPIEHTNSIFVRVDESRVDVMKAIIMGAAGTPYGHGAFEYDIFFDESYPNAPPKVNLTTTGSGKVRFNPNLYHCGKVCLSLLGTWRGNASENWDSKLSTLLQVLVSIQAIIMSEEIYFNEPGYEGEAGTDEGEKKNEAYCNIVRYCNIKYAMIDQIRNPPKGFETVIRRHFYLKKNEILEEVRKWVKFAEHRGASYSGLVTDHNSSWCTTFKASKNKYKEMLTEAIKELETELNKLQPPSGKDLKQKVLRKKEKKAEKVNIEAGVANLEEIDVSYEKDQVIKHKEMDIQDESVKDRWSRYIGAMGLDAVTKQANASIFMSGLGALGLEIAKNVVLSGVKRFTIHDTAKATYRDLSGQFYLTEEDIGKNRAEASLNKISQLNHYVKVDTALLDQKLPKDEAELDKLLKGYTLVMLSETDYETQIAINEYCRKNKIYFISTDLYGPFAKTFSDFGDEFVVLDKNGEELQEVMIASITTEEKALVTLLPGHTHKFEDGDFIVIHGVEGMDLIDKSESNKDTPQSINQTRHAVSIVNASSFRIGDTRGYTEYVRNGLAKPLKTPVSIKFKSLKESLEGQIPFDPNMVMHDFLKISHPTILHIAFKALDKFIAQNNTLPKPWDLADSDAFIQISQEVASTVKDYNHTEDKRFEVVLRRFAFTCQGVFSPMAAFMGGYLAQEAIKAITQKFMPTQQFFYTDCYEVIPELPENKEELREAISKLGVEEKKNRSDGLRICVGNSLLEEIQYTSLFMVGAGAIGCELLKNYAMLGIGTGNAGVNGRKQGGKIVLTDPDVIEVSNLNRQFLFREKHLRKPKSQTAAAAALQMNKELKGHVIARLDKVHEGTSNIFTDKFFEELTVVTNALDNVQARRYIDLRCVNAKTPLLESGTLGPKGHVQVIIPYKTESYSSQEDPKDEAEIPHCTLKMFPEETLHCVEWARDKFGKLFTQRPKGLVKLLETSSTSVQVHDPQELKTLREAVTLLEKKPSTFDDCIRYARIKFQKYFVNDIRQLLYTYPLDFKTKEGRPFWSLPKRPPTEITFDPNNLLHASFITACACLRANVFNIPIPNDARKDSGKLKIAAEAAQVKVPDFKPSDEKSKEINSEVKKTETTDKTVTAEEQQEEEDDDVKEDEVQELTKKFEKFSADLGKNPHEQVKPEEFEKDNDQNFHIDFIHAIANCRASNYKLENMEWITVKLKAGRIVPALATTTASVAGLQTIELIKLLKKSKIEDMKNAFLSLAVPILALSEPGTAPTTKLTEKLTVNIWDRWDVNLPRNATLKDLFTELENTYDLKPKDVTYGNQNIYFHALMDIKGKEKEKEEKLNSKLEDLLGLEKEDKYADLSVMFSRKEENEIVKGAPSVRAFLQDK